MDASLTTTLQKEVVRIGDWLLSGTLRHSYGWSWKTINQRGETIRWEEQESVYNGVGGIALYFLALYRYTGEEKYGEAARQGARWMIHHHEQHPSDSFSLFTGRFSSPWVLVQLYTVTGEGAWLRHAQAVVASPTLKDFGRLPLAEVINGTAGTLVGLLHLHAADPQDTILATINQYADHLLRSIRHGSTGFYWDRSAGNIHGLCGLSHGVGGIGWAFLELGRYLQNPTFYWVAQQAFAYEDQFFDVHSNNWYDLRKGVFTDQEQADMRAAYQQGDVAFFTSRQEMNAWCHGAAGSGLCRLRAYELGQPAPRIAEALRKTFDTNVANQQTGSFTLCHGGGGNAELFIEAARVLGDPQHLRHAQAVAQRAVQSYQAQRFYLSGTKHYGEGTSLFLGTAGVGYFYLRLLSPDTTPSVLLPRVEAPSHPISDERFSALSISLADLQQQLYDRWFVRTLHYVDAPLPHHEAVTLSDRIGEVQARIEELPEGVRARADDVFRLERGLLIADQAVVSDALLWYAQRQKADDIPRLLALPPEHLLTQCLVIDRSLSLTTTQWNWSSSDLTHAQDQLRQPAGEHYYLLLPSLEGTQEQAISPFLWLVLTTFAEERSVGEAIDVILTQLDGYSAEQRPEVQPLLLQQVQAAIRMGLLLDPACHPINRNLPTHTETLTL